MKHITIKSGAVIGLQIADFDDGMNLLNVTLQQLVGVKLATFNMEELFKLEASEIKDALIKVVTSKDVQSSIWKCMESCTYQGPTEKAGARISRDTFKTEVARADFFPVAREVATFNLAPFFKNLEFASSTQNGVQPESSLPSGTS